MRIAVLADLHHYSPTLGTTGKAFSLREGSDQKCLKETGSIIDAAFERLKQEAVDAIVIAGDISNDGESVSHREICDKMMNLNQSIPVYLTTATHDWCCDGHARSYSGDEVIPVTDVFTPSDLRETYRVFGDGQVIAEYRTHLDKSSYCYELSPTLRLLALEDDQDGEGCSGYSDDHLQWICDQIQKAAADGAGIFAVQHHLLLENLVPLVNKTQKIGKNEYRANRLADAGLRLIFVGHSHMQRTSSHTSPDGNTITQINVGSLCGHPAAINYLDTDGKTATVTVDTLKEFTFDGEQKDNDYIKNHTLGVLMNVLNAAVADCEQADERLRALGIRIGAIKKIYPVVRFGADKLLHTTVGKAAKAVNALTFGKGVSKKAVKEIRNDKLLDYVLAIFLCVFDGSKSAQNMPDAAKTVAKDVASLPGRILKKIPFKKDKIAGILGITSQIEDLIEELVHPKRDHWNTVVEL